MNTMFTDFSKDFSTDGLWASVRKYAKKIGGEVVHKTVCLWLVIEDGDAPAWAKTVAMGALGYFISPVDLIPDPLPGGFVDDIQAVAAAFAILAAYITEEIKQRAWQLMPEWLRS